MNISIHCKHQTCNGIKMIDIVHMEEGAVTMTKRCRIDDITVGLIEGKLLPLNEHIVKIFCSDCGAMYFHPEIIEK